MSYLKKRGIGGVSSYRRQSQAADRVLLREPLRPDTRNARRLMEKLRAKYGDEVIDREIERLNQQKAPTEGK